MAESADDLLSGYHLALLRPFEKILGSYLAPGVAKKGGGLSISRAGEWRDAVRSYSHRHSHSVQFPLPPVPEQRAIVRYLDHADRRIRRYVNAKRKLIALLEEEKQSIVSQVVTRGLDPDVRLKPSGAEWFGDVPEHWEVRTLGRNSRLRFCQPVLLVVSASTSESDYIEACSRQ